jgi:ubiquitin C-terminal hydrolase
MPLAASFRKKATMLDPATAATGTTAAAGESNVLQVGDRIDLLKSGWTNCGIIRYRGPLKGVPNSHNKIFLGIELDEPNGKNNGSIGGYQMFECDTNCGVFCRPQIVRRAYASSSTASPQNSSATTVSAAGSATTSNNNNNNNNKRRPLPQRPNPSSGRSENDRRSMNTTTPRGKRSVTNGDKNTTPSPLSTSNSNNSHFNSNSNNNNHSTTNSSGGRKKKNQRTISSATSSKHMHRGRRTFDPSLSRIPGIKGLVNLGNTCFVNSVLQNINNLPPVRDYYLNSLLTDVAVTTKTTSNKNTDSMSGALTTEMQSFVRNMWLTKEPVLAPKNVFMELCKRVPRFGNRQQQDAVEALRYLFDGMDAEAIKKEEHLKKIDNIDNGIADSSSLSDENSNPSINNASNNSSNNVSPLSPQPCGLAVAKTGLVAEIFSGTLCSEISCDHCQNVSRVKERYSDLSLPIPSSLLKTKNKRNGSRINRKNVATQQNKTTEPLPPSTFSPSTPSQLPVVAADGAAPIDVDHEIAKEMQKEMEEQELRRNEEREAFEKELLSKQKNGTSISNKPEPDNNNDNTSVKPPVTTFAPRSPPPTEHDSSESGIETCMNHFFANEILEGRDCDHCSTRSNARRRYVLNDPLPKVFVIHVKRFAQTLTGRLKKINNYVSYPNELNVDKYCSKKRKTNNDSTSSATSSTTNHDYILSGVVVHGGTLHGGHYSAFIRHVSKKEEKGDGDDSTVEGGDNQQVDWIYISDARVRMATKEEALQRHGAYLLFYTRKDVATESPQSIPSDMLEKYTSIADVDSITAQLERQTLNGSGSKNKRKIGERRSERGRSNNKANKLSLSNISSTNDHKDAPPSPPTPSNNRINSSNGVQFPPVQQENTRKKRSPALLPVAPAQKRSNQIKANQIKRTPPSTSKNSVNKCSSLPRLGGSNSSSRINRTVAPVAAGKVDEQKVNEILKRRENRLQQRIVSSPSKENAPHENIPQQPAAVKANAKQWLKLLKKKKPAARPQ